MKQVIQQSIRAIQINGSALCSKQRASKWVTRRTEYKLLHIWGAFCLLVLILFIKYKEGKQKKVGQNGMSHVST